MDGIVNDPIDSIREDLQALKSTIDNYDDKLAQHNNEIALLLEKNVLLEAKNLESSKKISELEIRLAQKEDEVSRIGNDSASDTEYRSSALLQLVEINTNSYIFLYTSPICSLAFFMVGIVPCGMQFLVLSMFLNNLLDTATIPPDVAVVVRIAQVLAILITFLVSTAMLRAIRAVIYKEGFDEMAESFSSFAPWKFYFSNALFGMQGLLSNIVVFIQIMIADEVLDLLLNFTAILFVSELDQVFFYLAMIGYAGKKAEKIAKNVESKEVHQTRPKGILKYLHIIVFGLTMVAVFAAFGNIALHQISSDQLADVVKVEFGDEVDPILGLFSGCYEKQLNGGWDARVRYVQTQPDRGQGNFQFCLDDEVQTWVFATVQFETVCSENDFAVRSAEERSTSFDLLDAKGDQWVLRTGNPLSSFQVGEIDPSQFEAECGNIPFERINTSEEFCQVLTLDAGAVGFSGNYDWSKTFVFLESTKNETVQYYQHPVFVGESTGTEGYQLLFFAGRRWVLASATKLMTAGGNGGNGFNKSDVVALFETSGFWLLELETESLAFLSEAVTDGNDHGTPLGLQWYHSSYEDKVRFPFADTRRPIDAIFRCGKCNTRRNPCKYEGICEDDGTCTCRHGSTGKLCEIEPLDDGVCNPFFNTEPDGYDGGDCCVSTCSSTNCGVGDMEFAFGQSLQRAGIGFPNCIDPSMVPIIIAIHSEVGDLSSGSFESYTVEVFCEEGAKAPLRVGLDPSIVGTLNETLYLEDTAGSCFLKFIGIQSWSGINISYEIFDGLGLSSDSMLLMSEEKNIVADRVFPLPEAYSLCLKKILAGAIDQKHLYTGNYQDEAFAWLSKDVSRNGECSSDEEYLKERYALLALSFAEEPPKSWISSSDHCRWSRVTCDGSKVVEITYDGRTNGALKGLWAPEFVLLRHLERIDVFRNEFSGGSIPKDIYVLSSLTDLALSVNGLTGSIPSEVGKMSTLHRLSIRNNSFSGSIPSEIGNMSALTTLGLSSNGISGSVPSEVGKLSALTMIALFNNSLSGLVPSEVGNLSGLLRLSLSNNALSGRIPSEVGKMFALTTITLHNNAMSGNIPSEVGQLGALTRLSLHSNAFSGTIPSEIGNMSGLVQLRLYNNTLSGTLPSEVGKLGSLTSLELYSNMLSGALPSEFANLSALNTLTLQNNTFSGSLPSEVGNLGALTILSLYNNAFSGTLPSELANMTALVELSLYNNRLSGNIPSGVGNMIVLEKLHLSNNVLSGRVPSEIGLLGGLKYLNLRDNHLNATLPSEIGLLTNLETLIIGGNMLSGRLPTEILQLTNLVELDLSGNYFRDEEVKDIMVALGLMCNETSVEVVVSTIDDLANLTTWEISTGNGTIVASGGVDMDKDEKTCIPVDACKFTVFGRFENGSPTFKITRLGKMYQINVTLGEKMTVVDICV